MPVFYETDAALSQYLLFHYGAEEDLMPYPFGPKESINFPSRIVTDTVDRTYPLALDLGCAVGRSSFELTRYCSKVIGVDYSASFIAAAQEIQRQGHLDYNIAEEGASRAIRTARLPEEVHAERVCFICADALEFLQSSPCFDLVLAANLLCRLPHPSAFLAALAQKVAPNGTLILTTPFSWLEEYTPCSEWIEGGLNGLQHKLKDAFELSHSFDLPFIIREHARKYQWCVPLVSIWRRKID